MSRLVWAPRLLFVAAGIILVLTLSPGEPGATTPGIGCFACGSRGLADALLNVALYVPLGIAFGLWGRSTVWVCLIALALSGTVELTQVFLPGRDANIGDVAFNFLGTVAGFWLTRHSHKWLNPSPGAAGGLCALAVVATIALWASTGWLLGPVFPTGVYWVDWTPIPKDLEPYHGRVLDATLGPLKLSPPALWQTDSVSTLLMNGHSLSVRIAAGPPTDFAVAPILFVQDDLGREVIMLGVDGEDFVFRQLNRAVTLHFDRPDLRLFEALRGVSPGEMVHLSVWRDAGGRDYCLEAHRSRSCSAGFTVGIGWAFLFYIERLPPWAIKILNLMWIVVLVLPVGLWARWSWPTLGAAGGLLAAAALLPGAVGLQPTPPLEYAAVLSGIALGHVLYTVASARRGRLTGASMSSGPG